MIVCVCVCVCVKEREKEKRVKDRVSENGEKYSVHETGRKRKI